MGYYPPAPPPPEDPIIRLLREVGGLSSRVDQLVKSMRNVESRVEDLSNRVAQLEKGFGELSVTLNELSKAQNLVAGLSPQNVSELMNTLNSTLRELTRIEASLLAYRDHVAGLQGKIESAVDSLSKVLVELKDSKSLNMTYTLDISNQLANISTKLNELSTLMSEIGLRIESEIRRSLDTMEGLRLVVLDIAGQRQRS